MKKLIAILGAGLFVLVCAMVGVWVYLGGFSSPKATEGTYGSFEVIYSTHKGSFAGLKDSWDKFRGQFEAAGLKTCDGLSFYLDNPEEVDEADLRSVLACRIDGQDPDLQRQLKASIPSFAVPQMSVVQTQFRYRNEMSFFVGPMKAYPVLRKFIDSQGWKPTVAIEHYGNLEATPEIIYMMPKDLDPAAIQALVDAF